MTLKLSMTLPSILPKTVLKQLFFVGPWSWSADSYKSGFYKPTVLKVNPFYSTCNNAR